MRISQLFEEQYGTILYQFNGDISFFQNFSYYLYKMIINLSRMQGGIYKY
jgi:hypothetical protein